MQEGDVAPALVEEPPRPLLLGDQRGPGGRARLAQVAPPGAAPEVQREVDLAVRLALAAPTARPAARPPDLAPRATHEVPQPAESREQGIPRLLQSMALSVGQHGSEAYPIPSRAVTPDPPGFGYALPDSSLNGLVRG